MSNATGESLRHFRKHLQLYQQQADEALWKCDHQTAMKCRDLEEYIGIGLSFFKLMKERARAVSQVQAPP